MLVWAYPKLTTYLQSFHLFLFFFVFGYLLKKERLTESLGRVTLRYVKYLLIPYAFFSAINWILNASMGATQEQLIRNLVMANLTFGAIWFLLAQFICCVVAVAVIRLSNTDGLMILISVALLLAVYFFSCEEYNYFRYWQGLFGVFFFIAGYIFRKHEEMLSKKYRTLIGIGLMLVGAVLAFANEVVHFSRLELAILPLTVVAALCSIIGLFAVLHKAQIGKNPINWYLAFLGRNSMAMLCTHYYIIYFITDRVFINALSGTTVTEHTWIALVLVMLIQTAVIYVWYGIKLCKNKIMLLLKR